MNVKPNLTLRQVLLYKCNTQASSFFCSLFLSFFCWHFISWPSFKNSDPLCVHVPIYANAFQSIEVIRNIDMKKTFLRNVCNRDFFKACNFIHIKDTHKTFYFVIMAVLRKFRGEP